MNTVIEAKGLTKQYGTFAAVNNIALSLQKGEVYGLLGPNGSGKTTTILMLLGLTEPSAGEIRVLGLDPVRQPLSVKAQVGYLPDSIGFYDNMTARENLFYIARLNGLARTEAHERITAALDRMGLSESSDHKVGTFSRGMRQRLGVAELLLKQPQIIIMDEPTLGLDPDAARRFLQTIQTLKEEGITIMLASHLLHQVQAVCDRVGLFRNGRIVLEGSVPELAQRVLGGAYRIRLQADGSVPTLRQALSHLPGLVALHPNANNWYELETTSDLRADAAHEVIMAGGKLTALEIEMPSLDDIYTQYFEEVPHVSAN